MANTSLDKLSVPQIGLALLVGQFKPNGAGSPLASDFTGKGFVSVTRLSAGLWTILLQDKWIELVSFNMSLASAAVLAGVTPIGQLVGVDLPNKTITVRTFNAVSGLNLDQGPGANTRYGFQLLLRNQTMPGA